ncbi:hypothetical protein F5888DRAFT_1709971 [Russula emetica]|nr:hypothetical protein F5888DRAFT_1709971 [Russula emetica]
MVSMFSVQSNLHLFYHYHILASGFSGHVIHPTLFHILRLLTTFERRPVASSGWFPRCVTMGIVFYNAFTLYL